MWQISEVWVGYSLNAIVHVIPGIRTFRAGIEAVLFQPEASLAPLKGRRWAIEPPISQVDAALQLGLPSLLPAPQSLEHGAVEDQHDRARDEEGADGGIHNIVVILQLTHGSIPIWNIVEAKDDWGGHSKSKDPGGGDQDQLPQVDLSPVVVQRDGDSNEPGRQRTG